MASGPPQTRYAQSSGAKIAYQVSGAGPPDLLMVPGLVSHLDLQWQQADYRRFVRALERGGRLIRLDKRGTGLSDPVGELPTAQERVQDVAAVMAAVKSSRAVLFGVSDGGRAAIAFAAAHPGRTQGLVLYGTSYRGPGAALLRRYRSVVRHWGEGRLAELVAPSLAGPEMRQAAGAFERAAASPAMAAALVESLGLIDVRDLMSGLTVPVLVLHRDGDLVPVADALLVAGQIPGAVLKILPGRDHLPWVADWAAVIEEILAFVGRVAPPPPGPGRRETAGSRPPRPAVGWPALTDAELPVVRLAGEGLTNAQIAGGCSCPGTPWRRTSSTPSPSSGSSRGPSWPRWWRARDGLPDLRDADGRPCGDADTAAAPGGTMDGTLVADDDRTTLARRPFSRVIRCSAASGTSTPRASTSCSAAAGTRRSPKSAWGSTSPRS